MNTEEFDNLPIMIHSIDGNGRLLYANRLWLSNLGYEWSEVEHRDSIDFLTMESREFARKLVLPLFFSHNRIKIMSLSMFNF